MDKDNSISLKTKTWIILGVGLACAPHILNVPLWITAVHYLLLFICAWFPLKQAEIWFRHRDWIHRVKKLLVIAAFIGIAIQFRRITGPDAGVSLLIILSAFKVFESDTKRDFYICVFLSYFLSFTHFLFDQSMLTACYLLLVTMMMTAALIALNDTRSGLSINQQLRLAFRMLLQALPVMIILFFLFPRISGPIFGLANEPARAVTGISDSMSPGSISQLTQSNKIAFRVEFMNAQGEKNNNVIIPEKSDLYWRGPVLWDFDGKEWLAGKTETQFDSSKIKLRGDPVYYEVLMEETNQFWFFALELPDATPSGAWFSHDLQIKNRKSIRKKKNYALASYTDFTIQAHSKNELQRGLQLREDLHPQAKALAQKWLEIEGTSEGVVRQALSYFNTQEFYYSLNPPLLLQDTVDEFLFSTREGFCEHYASAFVVLMRAAGIPARVVTGYQGGEINDLGNFLVIRQRDAHAWSEVFIEDKGWIRVDPTAAVSPERIKEGLEEAIPEAVFDLALGINTKSAFADLWLNARDIVDAVNYQWNHWVVSYGPERQKDFLKLLGFKDIGWQVLLILLFILLASIMLIITWVILKNTSHRKEPVQVYYEKLLRKLNKLGIEKHAYEGPKNFVARLDISPEIKNELNSLIELYILIRYASMTDKLDEFKQGVTNFNPKHYV